MTIHIPEWLLWGLEAIGAVIVLGLAMLGVVFLSVKNCIGYRR